ncbi:MAG: 7TM-DISM domain-containing protein, partial [Pseudomonadota bacterium]
MIQRQLAQLIFLSFLSLPLSAFELAALSIYIDRSSSENFETARQQNFIPIELEELTAGIQAQTFWLKISFYEPPKEKYFLSSCFIGADYLDAFLPQRSGWQHLQTGDQRNYSQRQVDHPCYVFDLGEIDDSVVYIRSESILLNRLPLSLQTHSQFWQSQWRKQLEFGFFLAFLLSMAIYNAFLFFITRDRTYGFYVGYLVMTTLFIGEMSGHNKTYLWPDSQHWTDSLPLVFASISLA